MLKLMGKKIFIILRSKLCLIKPMRMGYLNCVLIRNLCVGICAEISLSDMTHIELPINVLALEC